MQKIKNLKAWAIIAALGLPLIVAHPALAADGDVAKVNNFILTIIGYLVSIAGGIAAIFFVMGGIQYMTSSGNPERLEKAKHTMLYTGIGLVVCFGAFLIVTIISDVAKKSFGS